jgi:glutamate formiminotransferase / formiminotetrahydrofolate cyclodeaminase
VGEEPLVEIVPNFSEGRRRDVVDAIVEAAQVPGVLLVNTQWDPDHNRLDCSLIGAPDAVRASALAGAARAVELIDMDEHQGSHPRMGAVDVIPFVPVRGVTMQECVALARQTGQEIAETLGLPVYLYDRAALVPERASLAEVRKGEYEGLKADVAAGRRLPDFGPHRIGKAGAVAVGARKPLIAFNVYLSGTDEAGAKEIARAVRESSGGLPAVRAIGFLVEERGCVTVSMNLVDHEVTGIRTAFEAVQTEAGRRGMQVLDSEIVGLVPRAALEAEDRTQLRLVGFDPNEQVLENLVERRDAPIAGGSGDGIRSLAVDGFLRALASDAPTPGGGSVAAVAGAMGTALVSMVGRLTIGRKGYEDAGGRMVEIVKQVDEWRESLLGLADRDAEAFDRVMEAFKLPKDTDALKAERSAAIQRAFLGAAEVPLEVAERSVEAMDLAREAVEKGNVAAASDGAAAAAVLFAAVQGALANVEINVSSLKDADTAARLQADVKRIDTRSKETLEAAFLAFRRAVSS